MTITRAVKIIIFILLIAVCLFSFVLYKYHTNKLDIKTISLKKGVFDLSNRVYEFSFNGLENGRYNIVLKLFRERNIDFSMLAERKIKYAINIELRDIENNLLKSDSSTQDSKIHEGWANEYVELYFMPFIGEMEQKYSLKIAFQSDNDFFDKMTKEIYVEEIYDSASAPWWALLQRISLIVFIITLLPILIIGFLWLKKVKKDKILSSKT